MKKLSLFSGIGGIDLAAHWAGMETVVFCEREPFPQRVLRKHWPDVPIIDDVHGFTRKELERLGIGTIDLISAGYPCQPFSHAGKRRGTEDDRHLWPEVKRILEEIRPRWFVGENVAGHVTLGLDDVLSDLGGGGLHRASVCYSSCGCRSLTQKGQGLHCGLHRAQRMRWGVTEADKGRVSVRTSRNGRQVFGLRRERTRSVGRAAKDSVRHWSKRSECGRLQQRRTRKTQHSRRHRSNGTRCRER